MIANSLLLSTIEELSAITKTDYIVYSDSAQLLVSTTEESADVVAVTEFIESPADSQVVGDDHYFKVKDEGECVYVVIARGRIEDVITMGRVAVSQLTLLLKTSKDRLDRTGFFQNLILDNLLLVDIHNRATKLHIDNDVRRVVFLIENNDKEGVAMEVLKSLYIPQAGNNILSVDEQTIILIKDIDSKASRQDISDIANEIYDVLSTEAMLKVRVAYGMSVNELKDISKSYKEARMALDVGDIFYSSMSILSYENLGIGRLIYQLPVNLCELFVNEVFGGVKPEDIDEETLSTINKFFENNLNVSEASRQLYIHRNTLVNRLEKLQKQIGLDMRVFDDALTFKIAMMVVDYVNYLHNNEI